MQHRLDPAELERRQAAALADDENLELASGFYRFRQWRERKEAARRPDSLFARPLSARRRAAVLAALPFPLVVGAFTVAGESPILGSFLGLLMFVSSYLIQSILASRHPTYSQARSLGDLVWTAGCCVVAAIPVVAMLLLLGLWLATP